VLWPEDDPKGLLSAMSEICRELRDPAFLRRLRTAANGEDFAQLIHSHAALGVALRTPPP
jgi:PTS system nitrogen regulatory IIA component